MIWRYLLGWFLNGASLNKPASIWIKRYLHCSSLLHSKSETGGIIQESESICLIKRRYQWISMKWLHGIQSNVLIVEYQWEISPPKDECSTIPTSPELLVHNRDSGEFPTLEGATKVFMFYLLFCFCLFREIYRSIPTCYQFRYKILLLLQG